MVEAIGWAAALAAASLAIPQGVRIAVTRSVAGVSVLTWQTLLIAGMAWTGHGVLTGIPQILWPNVVLGLTSAWVLGQLTAAHRLPVLRTWGLPVVVAAVALAADIWIGPVAYGVIAFIPGAIGSLSQLREILRTPDPAGVSMASLSLNLLSQVLWFSFALPKRELAVLSVSVPIGLLLAASVAALAWRRHQVGSGLTPPRVRPAAG